MIFSILTLFPEMFNGPFDASIIKRAKEKGIVKTNFINIRDFAEDAYKTVDGSPYGGGQGMILRVDVVDRALSSLKGKKKEEKIHTILLTPQGKQFTQSHAKKLAQSFDHIILLCGHYEGIDERIRTLVDEEISIGDYILTGGEIPAMVLVDSITRLLPGVFKKELVTEDESFSKNTLEHPQYTKPQSYKGIAVPSILLSGNHKEIEAWRKEESRKKTQYKRPDLLN